MNNLILSQLICTRISHDLSGVMGAVYNGAELLQEDEDFADQAASLIQNSATDLMAKMRFFRQTFGLPKDSEDTTGEYLKTFSIPFELSGVCTNNLQRALVMGLTDYFYKGATFEVTSDGIFATGKALKECTDFISLLKSGQGEETAVNAPAFFIYQLCQQEQKTLEIEIKENINQVIISIK